MRVSPCGLLLVGFVIHDAITRGKLKHQTWQLIESLPVGVVYVQGEQVYFNRAAGDIIGYQQDEITTRDQWRRRLQCRFDDTSPCLIQRKDGQYRLVEFTGADDLWVLQDVTERQKAADALNASEQKYRLLFESNPQPICVIDQESLQILDVNDAMIQHYGYSRAALLAMRFADLCVHPEVDDPLASTGRHRTQDGTVIEVELASHSLTLLGRPAALVLVRDVTDLREFERQRTQLFEMLEQQVSERTHEIEQRRRVAEGLTEIIALLNANQSLPTILEAIVAQAITLLNADACAIYRLFDRKTLRIQTAQGMPLISDYPAVLGQAVVELKPVVSESVLAAPLVVKDDIYGGIVLHRAHPLNDVDVELASTFANQAALAIRNALLMDEVEQLAVTEERNRLARELHDAVTQTLFATTLIAEVLPEMWAIDPDEGRRRVDELRVLTRGALAEMRMLLLELRPSRFKGMSLDDLLRQLVEATTGRARIPITLTMEGEAQLPETVQLALYRICQESLNNIIKHAHAAHAAISLRCCDDWIALDIVDDGCGFDPKQVASEHFGLDIIAERAESIGARLRISSQPGQGTRIQVRGSL